MYVVQCAYTALPQTFTLVFVHKYEHHIVCLFGNPSYPIISYELPLQMNPYLLAIIIGPYSLHNSSKLSSPQLSIRDLDRR